MGSNRLEVLLTGDARPLNDTLAQVRKEVRKTTGDITGAAGQASAAFGALAAGGGLMTSSFLESASQMQTFEATLKALTGSSDKAREQLAKMAEFAAKTPFDLPGVVEAGVKITSLGQSVDRFLPMAGNMAAVMGRSIPEAAQVLAKAASGSQDGIQQLSESWGITKRELIAAGAAMGDAGAIASSSGNDIAKLQNALQKVIETKFGKAMEDQSKTLKGAFSNLSDSIGQVKAQLGEKLAPAAEAAARTLTKLVDGFKALPDSTKEMIAQAVLLVTAVAGVSAALVGMAAVSGPLIAIWGTLTASIGTLAGAATAAAPVIMGIGTTLATIGAETVVAAEAFGVIGGAAFGMASAMGAAMGAIGTMGGALMAAVAPLLGLPAILAAVAIGLGVWTASINANTKQQEAQLKVGVRLVQNFHDQKVAIGATADALRQLGKTDLDITKLMAGYAEFAKAAREAGNKDLADKYEAEVARLRSIRNEFRGTEDAKVAAVKATQDATKDATSKAITLADEFQKKRSDGFFATKILEQQALASTLAALEAQVSAIGKLDEKAAQDVKERIKKLKEEQTKLDREARKEMAENAIKDLEEKSSLGKISKDEESKQLKILAEQYGDVQNFKRDTTFKAEQAAKASILERIEAEAKGLDVAKQLSETKSKGIEDQIKQGGDLVKIEKQLLAGIQERAKLEEAAIRKRLSGDLSKASDPKVKAQLELDANKEIEKSQAETAQKKLALEAKMRSASAERIKIELDGERARKSVVDQQVDALRNKLAEGEQVGDQLKEQLALQQKIEEKILARTKAERLAEADPKDLKKIEEIKKSSDDTLAASRAKYQQTEKKTNQEIATSKARDHVEATTLARREHEEKLAQIEERKAQGKDTAADELAAAKEGLKLRLEEIQARAQADVVGKSQVEQARVMRQAELDMAQARREGKKDIDAHNKGLKDGVDLLQKQKDLVKGLDDELKKLTGEQSDYENTNGPIIKMEDMGAVDRRKNRISELESQKRRGESDLGDLERAHRGRLGDTSEVDKISKDVAMEAGGGASASAAMASGTVAIQSEMLAVLKQIAGQNSKPAQIEIKNSKPATEELGWGWQTNRASGL